MIVYQNELFHFGVTGMKWGIRKKKDSLNSKDRILKKGTEIQSISKGELSLEKGRRLYSSHTKFDNDSYVEMIETKNKKIH